MIDARRTNVYLICTHSFWSDQLRVVSLSREKRGFCAFGFSLAYAFEFNFEGLCKTRSLNFECAEVVFLLLCGGKRAR